MTDSSDTPAVPDGPALPVAPPTPADPAQAAPTADAPATDVPATDIPPADGLLTDVPPADEGRTARSTRRRKAALRWGAAAVVCALAGTGSALAVTAPERTDLPGLATKGDGRYTFPPLVLPPLPSGKAAPKENKSRHAADLRGLLLPVPKEAGGSLVPAAFPPPAATPSASTSVGATASATSSASPAVSPSTGATPGAVADPIVCDAFADAQKDPAAVRSVLFQNACRAAAVREWTADDGTRTQIRLLAFGSSFEGRSAFTGLRDNAAPKDVPELAAFTPPDWDTVFDVNFAVFVARPSAPGAESTVRLAYLSAGDLVGVVTMTNPKGVPAAAFRQVATLQSDLLA
ncbi:hypothetical protein ACFVFS_06545 [Kitasatospora sp. NPDC057692]|uniref:hypothetical protein n=1 Tax=Kitasatospora sp. NPDC057692 TaxID=3346215 RepID=UPI003684A6E4